MELSEPVHFLTNAQDGVFDDEQIGRLGELREILERRGMPFDFGGRADSDSAHDLAQDHASNVAELESEQTLHPQLPEPQGIRRPRLAEPTNERAPIGFDPLMNLAYQRNTGPIEVFDHCATDCSESGQLELELLPQRAHRGLNVAVAVSDLVDARTIKDVRAAIVGPMTAILRRDELVLGVLVGHLHQSFSIRPARRSSARTRERSGTAAFLIHLTILGLTLRCATRFELGSHRVPLLRIGYL